MKELIAQGYLCPYEIVGSPYPLKNDEIAQSPVEAYQQYCPGEKTVVFAAHLKAASEFTEQFTAAGIQAVMVSGSMDANTRRASLTSFMKGSASVIVNCGVLTEGFDHPPVSAIILARSIGSIGLYLQVIGRGLRLYPGKSRLLIIDLHGSSHIHGAPDDDREWSLLGEAIKKPIKPNTERFCKGCGVLLEGNETICDLCATARPEMVPPTVVNIKLVKFASKLREDPTKRAKYLASLFKIGQAKGYKPGAAFFKYKAIYNESPPHEVVTMARAILREEKENG